MIDDLKNQGMPGVRHSARMFVCVALLGCVLVPLFVPFSPDIYWDVDPRSQPEGTAVLGLGPAGQVGWAGIAMLVSIAAVAVSGVARWRSALLILIGAVPAIGWGLHDAVGGYVINGWLTALMLALGALHLSSDARCRRFMVSALMAASAPLLLDALLYQLIEHRESMRYLLEHEADLLRGRGWEPGSTAHQEFMRRASFNDYTGALGLSNVMGTVLGAMAVAAGVIAWHCRRNWRAWLPLLAAVTALLMTQSKGAVVAALAVSAAMMLREKWKPRGVLLLCAMAVLAVVFRGFMGPPPTHEGERSLLFRWHYLQAGVQIITDHPLTGVGPGGFKDAYAAVKPAINPEEVVSTHNLVVDALAMLGALGGAWVIVAFGWVARWREEASQAGRVESGAAVALVGLVSLVQWGLTWQGMLTEWGLLAWGVGAVVWLLLTAWLPTVMDGRRASLAALAMAGVALVHSQIEMGFYQPSSAPLLWVMLALAGSNALPERVASRRGALPGLMGLLLAVWLVFYGFPCIQQQSRLSDAAAALRQGDLRRAAGLLALAPLRDASITRWVVHLQLEAGEPLSEAMRTLDRAQGRGMDAVSLRVLRAELLRRQGDAAACVAIWREVLDRAPSSLPLHLRAADAAWELGEREQARVWYRRCLALSDLLYLDPADMLLPRERERVEDRLAGEDSSP